MEWDTAAGHIILREAGCEIFKLNGRDPLEYNKENLTNPWFVSERVR
jgi:3'(2'), 5'-bisphosphate nucleotidase